MALNPEDLRPKGLSTGEKYRLIRTWYQANVSKVAARTDEYGRRSVDYIQRLPPPDAVSPDQIEDVFKQVRTGLLEWGYHESDGRYKMAAYAGA